MTRPPSAASGIVTFGCLNNPGKVSPSALAAWMEILRSVPGSRMLLMTSPEAGRIEELQRHFAARGRRAGARRIRRADAARATISRLHARIDIALDTWPYTGGTTTCDALWMGVPVVSLAGRPPVRAAAARAFSARSGSTIWSHPRPKNTSRLRAPSRRTTIDCCICARGCGSRWRRRRSTTHRGSRAISRRRLRECATMRRCERRRELHRAEDLSPGVAGAALVELRGVSKRFVKSPRHRGEDRQPAGGQRARRRSFTRSTASISRSFPAKWSASSANPDAASRRSAGSRSGSFRCPEVSATGGARRCRISPATARGASSSRCR